MSSEKFDRITKWAKLIVENPNYDCNHFYISDEGKTMIIDVSRLNEVPLILKSLKDKERAFLFIDLNTPKFIRYYAHDLIDKFEGMDKTSCFVNEIEGEILFSLLESDVLKYIENNIKDITNHLNPVSRFVEMNQADYSKKDSVSRTYNGHAYEGKLHKNKSDLADKKYTQETSHNYGNFINNNSYKERETFMDALYDHVKAGKTGDAVDRIYEFVLEKKDDADIINNVFKYIVLDKLNLVSIKELLVSTEKIKNNISDRKIVLNKFETMISDKKRAASIIREINAAA